MKVSSSSDINPRCQRIQAKSNSNLVSSTSSNKYTKYTKECTYLRLTNRNLLNYLPEISSTSWFKNNKQVIFPQTIQKIDDNGFKESHCQKVQQCVCAMCPDGNYYPQIEVYDGPSSNLDDNFIFKDNTKDANVNSNQSENHLNVIPEGFVKVVPRGANWFKVNFKNTLKKLKQ